MMDIVDLRAIITVVSFVVFLLIVVWAYSSRQRQRFDEAANLPFADDEMQRRTVERGRCASGQHGERSTISPAYSGRNTSNKETFNG